MFQTFCIKDCLALDHVASEADLARMWNTLNWKEIQGEVFRLQCRIARSAQDRNLPDIMQLQSELVASMDAKVCAVREVTRKKSRDTPGVDGVLWKTAAEKMHAAYHLGDPGYRASPVRRVYIPKEKPGRYRPLGIATMPDRAVQKLYALALQPVAETWGDPGSFGYRLFRSAKDACRVIRDYLIAAERPLWVFDADITECFDRIRHDWLMEHIPLDRQYLNQVLTAGYVYRGRWHPVARGVPQGGILSPILANMALDGLEPALIKHCSDNAPGDRKPPPGTCPDLLFVRYADDMVVLAPSLSTIGEAGDVIAAFLLERGLSLSQEKTRIVPAEQGFTFLHWHFRKKGRDVHVTPSGSSLRRLEQKISRIFFNQAGNSPERLIRQLNPLIRGFAYYHRGVDSALVFRQLDSMIRQEVRKILRLWCPERPDSWLMERFWSKNSSGLWNFYAGADTLFLLSNITEERIVPVETTRNPYLDRSSITRAFRGGDALQRAVSRDRKRQKRVRTRWRVDDYA
ncbi:MAG: Reverse transcriptase (RNA-dependent DNA polymerase) [Methanoregulaceae archaeon PtaB.Bin009]|nr:MAG: Reverse transcriptase (RNA-dependent DNA polymerase) [Methanoregulaceae archaeon PtaB.Bin009]OPY43406.1 MAG: Reverse transcriptase (RNA-dependent DNA polymerase) [Methanoregulaceae archaeon PtaU1.Bin222]